jgi:hypothetical protein
MALSGCRLRSRSLLLLAAGLMLGAEACASAMTVPVTWQLPSGPVTKERRWYACRTGSGGPVPRSVENCRLAYEQLTEQHDPQAALVTLGKVGGSNKKVTAERLWNEAVANDVLGDCPRAKGSLEMARNYTDNTYDFGLESQMKDELDAYVNELSGRCGY